MAIDKNNIPKHIAIILDGNGRWAKSKNKPRTYGHREGARNIGEIVKASKEIGIKCLTVYAFSTENWNRPKDEVNFIMTEPIKEFNKNNKRLKEVDFKIKFIGRRTKISSELREMIEEVEVATKDKEGFTLVIAADYGSRYELTEVVKKISEDVKNDKIDIDDINETMIEDNLYTKDLPKLDLLIRTSGEVRISNFLLWQLSYSELYFTEKHWPEFDKKELHKAIENYQNRNRRYGGLKEGKNDEN